MLCLYDMYVPYLVLNNIRVCQINVSLTVVSNRCTKLEREPFTVGFRGLSLLGAVMNNTEITPLYGHNGWLVIGDNKKVGSHTSSWAEFVRGNRL
jgi:hypothetical protein